MRRRLLERLDVGVHARLVELVEIPELNDPSREGTKRLRGATYRRGITNR